MDYTSKPLCGGGGGSAAAAGGSGAALLLLLAADGRGAALHLAAVAA